MHNCKAARETLIALALSPADQTQSLPAELEACAGCRKEYASLRNALRVADEAKQTALPAESFWPGYHARLRQHLETGSRPLAPTAAFETGNSLSGLLGKLFMTSVRVPLPLAAALLLFLGVAIVFALNSHRPITTALPGAPPTVVTKIVEVPVAEEKIRERVVTRVVYRERDRRQPLSKRVAANIARRKESAAEAPISLVGFKPANDVKLTIIKGSDPR